MPAGSSVAFGTLTCPSCGAALPPHALDAAKEELCPGCRVPLRGQLFPAWWTPPSSPATSERALEGEAVCFFHPSNRAALPCDVCGRFLCTICDLPMGSRHLCPVCLSNGLGKEKTARNRASARPLVLGFVLAWRRAVGGILGILARAVHYRDDRDHRRAGGVEAARQPGQRAPALGGRRGHPPWTCANRRVGGFHHVDCRGALPSEDGRTSQASGQWTQLDGSWKIMARAGSSPGGHHIVHHATLPPVLFHETKAFSVQRTKVRPWVGAGARRGRRHLRSVAGSLWWIGERNPDEDWHVLLYVFAGMIGAAALFAWRYWRSICCSGHRAAATS